VAETVIEGPMCSKCNENPAGPGGILCPGCVATINAQKLPTP